MVLFAVLIAPCSAEYQNALRSITFDGYFPQDATRAMTIPLRANKLDDVDAAIDGPLMKATPVEMREALHGAILELRRCVRKTPPAGPFESAPPRLRALEMIDGVLNANFSSLTLQLETATGEPLPVASLDAVELAQNDVTKMFAVKPDGTISLSEIAAFSRLADAESLDLRVRGKDRAGDAHDVVLRFGIGRHRPTFRLTAPSGLGTAVTDVWMRLVHLPSELSFWQASDSRGRVSFPQLPEGGYRIEAGSLRGFKVFAQQGFLLDGDKTVDVTLYANTGGGARMDRDGTVVPADAPNRYVRIAAMTIEAVGDAFKVRSLDIIDWPADRMDAEARERELVEAEQQLSKEEIVPTRRTVIVRAYDAHGQVTHRQIIRVDVPPNHAENFRLRVPLATTHRLEVQGWRPHRRVYWALDELRNDPSIEQRKVLFEPE